MEPTAPVRGELQRFVRSMSAGSRTAAGAAAVLGLIAIGGLLLRSKTQDLVPLSDGAGLNTANAVDIRASISAAGLDAPIERDGQLLVPASQSARYRDAVDSAARPPGTWAESWEAANAALNQFSLSSERNDVRDITRAKLTSRLLNELPGIQQADVVWDEERQPGWNRPPLVRATVYLRPRPGHRITLETVHAVRLAVAGSKAYLDPADVVVMDLSRLVAFDRGSLGDDFDSEYGRIARLTAEYRQRAEDALADIPAASVAVAVERVVSEDIRESHSFVSPPPPPPQSDPEPIGTAAPRNAFHQERPNTGLEVPVATRDDPRAVPLETPSAVPAPSHVHQVTLSVSIPRSHYAQVATARRLLPAASREDALQVLAAMEQELTDDVRNRLARIGPAATRVRNPAVVNVQSIDTADVSEFELVAPTAPPEQPFPATMLARFRSALMMVTVLTAAWIAWLLVRRFIARGRDSSAHAASSPPSADGAVPHQFSGMLASVPPDQLSQILNEESDSLLAGRILGSAAGQSESRRDSVSADPLKRSPVGAGKWDIDELAELTDDQLRRLVRSVAVDMWPAALSSALPSTRRRLLSALPDGEADQLRDVLHQIRPMRLDEIDQAQLEVHAALESC